MKRILCIFLFVVVSFAGFSLDEKYDFSKMKLEDIVRDTKNILYDGYVIKEDKFSYYGSNIRYSINCYKDDLSGSYLFFSSDNPEVLYDFFCDYTETYLNRSFRILCKDNITEGEVEQVYYISIDEEPEYAIYTRVDMKKGIRGFGITFASDRTELCNGTMEAAAILQNAYPDIVYLTNENVHLDDIVTGIVFYRNLDIPYKFTLNIKDSKTEWDDDIAYPFDAALVHSDSKIYFVNMHCDESLKSDPVFMTQQLYVNNKRAITFKELIDNNNYMLFVNEYSRFEMEMKLSEQDYERMKDLFYIEISGMRSK